MDLGDQSDTSAALPPGKRPSTHFTAGSVGPKARLNGCGKSRPPTGIRSPDRPTHQRVAILLKLTNKNCC
jgi:hypothetical protein